MYIRWQGCVSSPFSVGNGVRQVGILSPFLFRFYVRNIISTITGLGYGCNVGGTFINMYAMVLLAPSWNALQCMLSTGRPNKKRTFVRYHIFSHYRFNHAFLLKCSEITAEKNKRQFL